MREPFNWRRWAVVSAVAMGFATFGGGSAIVKAGAGSGPSSSTSSSSSSSSSGGSSSGGGAAVGHGRGPFSSGFGPAPLDWGPPGFGAGPTLNQSQNELINNLGPPPEQLGGH